MAKNNNTATQNTLIQSNNFRKLGELELILGRQMPTGFKYCSIHHAYLRSRSGPTGRGQSHFMTNRIAITRRDQPPSWHWGLWTPGGAGPLRANDLGRQPLISFCPQVPQGVPRRRPRAGALLRGPPRHDRGAAAHHPLAAAPSSPPVRPPTSPASPALPDRLRHRRRPTAVHSSSSRPLPSLSVQQRSPPDHLPYPHDGGLCAHPCASAREPDQVRCETTALRVCLSGALWSFDLAADSSTLGRAVPVPNNACVAENACGSRCLDCEGLRLFGSAVT